MSRIENVVAREILDSRGSPTLAVDVGLSDGRVTSACVPSGASTGSSEAHELRDGDPGRYRGKGVLKAVANVVDVIGPALRGRDPADQAALDAAMIELDGTERKERLGANAILGVSMACARAGSLVAGVPLYSHLGGPDAGLLPLPMMNVINGGMHAANALEFQEFMIVPHGAASLREAVRWGAETFAALRAILVSRGEATGVGDEGGFAPNLAGNDVACAVIVEAIAKAGFEPGGDISIALDPAASSFAVGGRYAIPSLRPEPLSSDELGAFYRDLVGRFPIVSIEDGFAEGDWDGFAKQTASLGRDVQIVGDDLYVTNPRLIRRGVAAAASNAVLIKPNQIGTVSETIEAIGECRRAGWSFIVSHRSGETEDAFIADLAAAMNGGQIKTGSLCRGERTAKYNRLMAIERELGDRALFANPFDRAATAGRTPTPARAGQPTESAP